MNIAALNKLLGNIDIYLLDQILKGRFTKEMRILDAGCGEGRNLIYFLHEGFQVLAWTKTQRPSKWPGPMPRPLTRPTTH